MHVGNHWCQWRYLAWNSKCSWRKVETQNMLWLQPSRTLQICSQLDSTSWLRRLSTSIFSLCSSLVPTYRKRGVWWQFPLRIIRVESQASPYSRLLKKNFQALIPQLALFEGLAMGEKAETDRNFPVLRAEMSAPCPPMLNPVMDLLSLLTGKNVETTSGSSSLMQVNIWKCFLVASLVALIQQPAEFPTYQSSSTFSMPVFLGLVSGKTIAILCCFACLAKPDFTGMFSLVAVSPASKQRAGQGFPRWCLISKSGRQIPKVIKPLTASLQCSTTWYSPSSSFTLLVTLILGRLTSGGGDILTIPLRQEPLCSSSTHQFTFSRPSNS